MQYNLVGRGIIKEAMGIDRFNYIKNNQIKKKKTKRKAKLLIPLLSRVSLFPSQLVDSE